MGPRGSLGKRVLVVEDDVTFRRSLCEALEDAGFTVFAASNGQDAIHWLTGPGQNLPDLILLDLAMPEVDGWRFRLWQRGHRQFRDIPILVISGHPNAVAIGAAAVLRKPVGPDRLIDQVAKLTKVS